MYIRMYVVLRFPDPSQKIRTDQSNANYTDRLPSMVKLMDHLNLFFRSEAGNP